MNATETMVYNELSKFYGVGRYKNLGIPNRDDFIKGLIAKYGKRVVTRVQEYIKENGILEIPEERKEIVKEKINLVEEHTEEFEYCGEVVSKVLEEYAELWKKAKDAQNQLEHIKEIARMELMARGDKYVASNGVTIKMVDSYNYPQSAVYTSYDSEVVKDMIGNTRLYNSITDTVVNANKLEGLVSAGKVDPSVLNAKIKKQYSYICCNK